MQFTDEQLNQLIDGELSPLEERALRDAMATNKELAARFAQLAMIDAEYKTKVSLIDEIPVPDYIVSLLSQDGAVATQNGGDVEASRWWSVASQWLDNFLTKPILSHRVATLASTFFLFAIVTVMMYVTSMQNNHLARMEPIDAVQYGVLDRSNPVAKILSNAPSGSPQKSDGNNHLFVTPVLSFTTSTGDICREYTVTNGDTYHRAVACHQDQGWRVILNTRISHTQDAEEYQTASAITPSAFEQRISQLIYGDPLSYQQELLLIDQGWKSEHSN